MKKIVKKISTNTGITLNKASKPKPTKPKLRKLVKKVVKKPEEVAVAVETENPAVEEVVTETEVA